MTYLGNNYCAVSSNSEKKEEFFIWKKKEKNKFLEIKIIPRISFYVSHSISWFDFTISLIYVRLYVTSGKKTKYC